MNVNLLHYLRINSHARLTNLAQNSSLPRLSDQNAVLKFQILHFNFTSDATDDSSLHHHVPINHEGVTDNLLPAMHPCPQNPRKRCLFHRITASTSTSIGIGSFFSTNRHKYELFGKGGEGWMKEDRMGNRSHDVVSKFRTRDPSLRNHGSRGCKPHWG